LWQQIFNKLHSAGRERQRKSEERKSGSGGEGTALLLLLLCPQQACLTVNTDLASCRRRRKMFWFGLLSLCVCMLLPCSWSFKQPQITQVHTWLSSSSKGFGAAKPQSYKTPELKTTRSTVARKVIGKYAKILARKAEIFEDHKRQGVQVKKDVYARLSSSQTFYFIGKVSYKEEQVQEALALSVISPLLLEYAKSLRPRDLSGPLAATAELQLWCAPGNSEMDVATHKVDLTRIIIVESSSGEGEGEGEEASLDAPEKNVGFEPEIYQGGEAGFRCVRDNDGRCVKAPINPQFGDSSMIPPSTP